MNDGSISESPKSQKVLEDPQSQLDPDDWTVAPDPTSKKRVQNRVAQRTYRSRMKKRLHELEKQVHEHERKEAHQAANAIPTQTLTLTEDPRTISPTPKWKFSDTQTSLSYPSTYQLHRSNLDHGGSYPEALIQASQNSAASVAAYEAKERQQSIVNEQQMYPSSNLLATTGRPFLPEDMVESPFSSTSIQSQHTLPLSVPPSDLTAPPSVLHPTELGVVDNFNVNDMTSSIVMLQPEVMKTDPMQLASNIWTQGTQLPLTGPAIPEFGGNLSGTDSSQRRGSRSTKATTSASPLSPEDNEKRAIQIPDADATIEDRIGYVISCAKQAGFDDLDSLVSAYYTEPFPQASSLSVEQRLSRHRRLPQVLAQLRQQITTWTQWERTGFEDEVLRTAEDICSAECGRFVHGDKSSARLLVPTLTASSQEATRRMFQDELPYLWAFLTSLTSNNMSMNHYERSNVVFTSMLLCCYWGHIPPSQILSWLNSCLEPGNGPM